MPHHIHFVMSFSIQQGELIPSRLCPSETYPDRSIYMLKTKYERKQLITSSTKAVKFIFFSVKFLNIIELLIAQESKENW